MDGRVDRLQEKLRQSLKETAELAAEIQRLDGSQAEVPHYSQIEEASHQMKRRPIRGARSFRG